MNPIKIIILCFVLAAFIFGEAIGGEPAEGIFSADFESPPPAVTIDSFAVTPAEIEAGNSVTVDWSVSSAAVCTATTEPLSTWAGSVNRVSGSQEVAIDAAGDYTFTLTCSNELSEESVNENVLVNDPPGCPAPTQPGRVNSWENILLDTWPEPSFRETTIAFPRREYLAIAFDTGNHVAEGGIVTIPVTANSGIRFGSISPCEGQFLNLPRECTQTWGIGNALAWTTISQSGSACFLEANTTYYLNFTFINPENGEQTCEIFGTGNNCATRLRVFTN